MTTTKTDGANGGRRGAGGEAAVLTAPSDSELMSYFDGELDDSQREAEIGAWLEQDDAHEGHDKLADMDLVATLLRDDLMDLAADCDVVDSLMDRLDAGDSDGADSGEVEKPPMGGRLPKVDSAKVGSAADGGASANDNARSIYGLAAMAAAIAAGLFFWGRTDPSAELAYAPAARPTPEQSVAALAPTLSRAPSEPVALADAVIEHDNEPTVEVAAVDFGDNSGSVFYVSGDDAGEATATAVVWITDEAGDEP